MSDLYHNTKHLNEIILGREGNQPFNITNSAVSKRHAKVTMDGDTWTIEDLGSTNGTFVKNLDGEFEQIQRRVIDRNTVIRLGDGGVHSLILWANHIQTPHPDDYSYEFMKLMEYERWFDESIEQETNKLKKKRYVPLALTGVMLLSTFLLGEFGLKGALEMWVLRLGSFLGPMYSAIFSKNDKLIHLANVKKKMMTCPKCGKPLSDYEVEQRLCMVCKAHA